MDGDAVHVKAHKDDSEIVTWLSDDGCIGEAENKEVIYKKHYFLVKLLLLVNKKAFLSQAEWRIIQREDAHRAVDPFGSRFGDYETIICFFKYIGCQFYQFRNFASASFAYMIYSGF